MNIASRITSQGQTTIPLEVREFLELGKGDVVSYTIRDGEVVLKKKKSVLDLAGILHDPDRKPLSIEEMKAWPDAAIDRFERVADDRD